MIDMVEAEQQMEAHLPLAENEQIEKELAEMSEDDKPLRLVSDGDYSAKRQLVVAAESDAKSHQLGIWSEAGFPGRAPPQDSYMIRRFRETPACRQPWSKNIAGSWYKLDANAELVGISGRDDVCLVVADILCGVFDNGVIKEYGFRRDEPNPIVDDLDHSEVGTDCSTVYRRVEGGWYLFEIQH